MKLDNNKGNHDNRRVKPSNDTSQDNQSSNGKGSHIRFISDKNPSSEINKFIEEYSHYVLDNLASEIHEVLGINLVGESGYGKTYLAFHLARKIEERKDSAVKIFSPSNIWQIQMGGGVYLVRVGTSKFNPVDSEGNLDLQPYEVEWLAKQLLRKETVIFKIQYHKPERILGFLVLCLRVLFSYNEHKKLKGESHLHYVLFLEECHLAFKSGSLHGDRKNELLKYISLGRSDADLHYVNITQRLAEVDVSLCERLGLVTTRQVGQNAIRKIKGNLPKILKKRVLTLIKRQFLWFSGDKGIIFWSPEYKHTGKPWKIYPEQPEQPEKKGFWERVFGQKKNAKSMEPLSIPHYSEEDTGEELDEEMEEDLAFLGEPDEDW